MNSNQQEIQQRQSAHLIRDSIAPYYRNGDIFQRQQTYYQQIAHSSRRDRSKDHSPFKKSVQPNVPPAFTKPTEDLLRLREQNKHLREEVQKLNGVDGQYGSGQQVIKKSHYMISNVEAKNISNQQAKILQLQQKISKNKERIEMYKKATVELEARMNNIQSLDQQIYKHLKGASQRDRQLINKATNALAIGQPRQEIARILRKIVQN